MASLDASQDTSKPSAASSLPCEPSTSSNAASESETPGTVAWTRLKERQGSAVNFVKAYGKSWVAMSPIYLLGEAVSGQKPGSRFRQEWNGLVSAAEELRNVATTSSQDILIIIDEKLRTASEETSKTAHVLREAGEHAVVVVSTNLEKSREQIQRASPEIKQSVLRNGKDCIIVVDKGLKHPLVITGVSRLARTQGVPHAEAVLHVASLGLSKILKILPDDEAIANMLGIDDVQEVEALTLEHSSSQEAQQEAARVVRAAEQHGPNTIENVRYKRDKSCTIV